jgi:hypothetical protein
MRSSLHDEWSSAMKFFYEDSIDLKVLAYFFFEYLLLIMSLR